MGERDCPHGVRHCLKQGKCLLAEGIVPHQTRGLSPLGGGGREVGTVPSTFYAGFCRGERSGR